MELHCDHHELQRDHYLLIPSCPRQAQRIGCRVPLQVPESILVAQQLRSLLLFYPRLHDNGNSVFYRSYTTAHSKRNLNFCRYFSTRLINVFLFSTVAVISRKTSSSAPASLYFLAKITGSPASRMSTKFTPLRYVHL